MVLGCTPDCFYTSSGERKLPPTPDAPAAVSYSSTTVTLQWDVPGAASLGRIPVITKYEIVIYWDGMNSTRRALLYLHV